MFHAPTSEAQQQSDPNRSHSTTEQGQELSPPVPALPGYAWLGAAGSGAPRASPRRSPQQQFARLHSLYGNQAVLRILSRSTPTIQTKLTVNQLGTPFEQEADRVAEQVMGLPEPGLQRACACGGSGGECAECKRKEEAGSQRAAHASPRLFSAPQFHVGVDAIQCYADPEPNIVGGNQDLAPRADTAVSSPEVVLDNPDDEGQGVAAIEEGYPFDAGSPDDDASPAPASHEFFPLSPMSGFASMSALGGGAPPPSPKSAQEPISRLQSLYGNQAVLRTISRSTLAIQAKLTVNEPGDPFEQEADRVADRVIGMTAPAAVYRKCSSCEEDKLQRKCDKCADEEREIHRKEANAGPGAAPNVVHDVLRSAGLPLDAATRAFMEPRFGHDFSDVRLHTDARAAESARAMNALAYTSGQHIVFGAGQHNPRSDTGRHLLAHELTHVLQQGSARATPAVQRQNPAPDESSPATETATPGITDILGDAASSACVQHFLDQGTGSTRRGSDSAGVVQRQSPQSASNRDDIPPVPCEVATTSPGPPDVFQEPFTFPNDVSDLTTVQRAQVDNFVRNWWAQGGSTPVRVDGFASKTGPSAHNWALSCWRANNVAAELKQPLAPELDGIPESLITVFMHGETTEFPSEGENRRATISANFGPTPPPGPTPPGPSPGPTPACTPDPIDLTKIPASMDANGFTRGAALLREWFGSAAHVRQPNDRAPVDASTITMDFVLGFDRAKKAFDQIFSSQLFANPAAQNEIISMLIEHGMLPTPSDPVRRFDFPRLVTDVDPDFDIQFESVGSVFDPIDDLTASLGEFTFRMAVAGSVQVDPGTGMFEVVIMDVGVHVRDPFDFEGFQLLGCWNVCTNQVDKFGATLGCVFVTNGDFRDWRTDHGRGGDFKVLSDLRIMHLATPVQFRFG